MSKKIEEISLMKGIGILFIVILHMSAITGLLGHFEKIQDAVNTRTTLIMMMFFIVSGYTISVKNESILKTICRRMKAILLPYYRFSIVIIIIDAIIFLGIDRKSWSWFADGLVGVLFQFQSFHWFDTTIQGVHPMFYGVLVGWYLFQYAVAIIVFTPLLYWVNNKNRIYKLVLSIVLISLAAVLYKLNLQGLNGEFFPTVCKIFVLPNIPGVAGLLMLGSFFRSLSLLDIDNYSKSRKLVVGVICLAICVAKRLLDDHIYDFPIGKWGSLGAWGYYLGTICGTALVILLAIICNQLKKYSAIKKVLLFVGNNTMDILVMHLFWGFVVARICGFWFNYLSEPNPVSDISTMAINTVILIVSVMAICCGKIYISQKSRNA